MDFVLAPTQMYILLAVVTIVATVVPALLQFFFPRRIPNGLVVSEKNLAADRWIIRSRRVTVIAGVAVFAFVWLGVILTMMGSTEEWMDYHLWHFWGLIFFFVLHMILIRYVIARNGTEALNLLPRPSVTIHPDSEASSANESNSGG